MTGTTKFTFDREFDADGNVLRAPRPRPKTRFDASEVEEIRQTAYREGLQAAEAKAAEAQAAALARLAAAAEGLSAQLAEERRAVTAEALSVALAAAKRLAGGLLEKEPPEEIETLFAGCLDEVRDVPRVAVHLAPALEADLAPKLAAIAQERGYEGKLTVKGDPAVPETDVRIDWGKGGAARAQAEILRAVEEAVENYLAADEPEQPDLFGA